MLMTIKLYGYGGNIIKINLSTHRITVERTPHDFIDLIGGKGYASKYFHENLNNIDPLSPDNIILIATGPASGTRIPIASKIGFYFVSPLTNFFGESYMGGKIMADMKWAGIDAFIIYGKSDKPVYIYAHDTDVEIRDARDIWGLDTHESETRICEDVGLKDLSVAVIGPAGENLVRFANVSHNHGTNNRESKAGRMGAGAVFGSKKLKGIAVAASERKVEVHNSDIVSTIVKEVLTKISRDPVGTGAKNYRTYGTPGMLFYALNMGFFPSHYFRVGGSIYRDELDPDNLKDNYYDHNVACFNCPFSCGKYTVVKSGEFAGVETKGPEYETIYAFGGLNDINRYDAIAKINELCDLYGLDTIETGNVISLLLYANEAGRLSIDNASFGDIDWILNVIRKIAYRDGIGDKLAEGVKRFSEEMNIEDLAIHVKGLSPAGYDPRVLKYMAFEYCVNNRGADHLRMTAYAYEATGRLQKIDGIENRIKFLVDVEDRNIIADSLILCRFSRFIYGWDEIIKIIYGITGINYDVKSLKEKANFIRTLIRKFNIRQGLNPVRDDRLSSRFYRETIKFGDEIFRITEEEVEDMVKIYYKLRGWDDRGHPSN